MKRWSGLFVALSLAGCGSKSIVRSESQAAPTLDANSGAYVSLPEDGYSGGKLYAGSGKMTALSLAAALGARVARVEHAESQANLDASSTTARGANCRYLFIPSIVAWEDRATEWSGRPDRLEILLKVYDLAGTGRERLIDTATLKGSSTFFTFGGDHPQDMLPGLFTNYANEVVRQVSTPPPSRN